MGGRINISSPSRLDEIEDRVGCYAILYAPGGENYYTVYIGYSKQLRTEVKSRYRNILREGEGRFFPFTAVYISSSAIAQELESDLIRYYAPPWNIRFS